MQGRRILRSMAHSKSAWQTPAMQLCTANAVLLICDSHLFRCLRLFTLCILNFPIPTRLLLGLALRLDPFLPMLLHQGRSSLTVRLPASLLVWLHRSLSSLPQYAHSRPLHRSLKRLPHWAHSRLLPTFKGCLSPPCGR